MTIVHHPSEETLVDYVAGTLDEGKSLVMATHIARCPECQATVRDLRFVAGAVLETCAVEAISPGRRSASLAQLEASTAGTGQLAPVSPADSSGACLTPYPAACRFAEAAARRFETPLSTVRELSMRTGRM